jgi:hypothetical protein|tara:strand:+ start:115 stop:276 length:162 start_codon:yes stop_codon:yes gene_type:complete
MSAGYKYKLDHFLFPLIANKEAFQETMEIFNNNTNLFELNFSFKSSGLAIIKN